jgi:hypothetical protein
MSKEIFHFWTFTRISQEKTIPVNHKNNLDMSKAELELHQKTKLILQEIS